jgi:hypothetical protein
VEIPIDPDEVPLSQMHAGIPSPAQLKCDPLPEISLRALRAAGDAGELWLVSKKKISEGKLPFNRVPGGIVTMGPGWIRTDGDPCPEAPTHIYVVANRA